jgi:hypothetical protein
VAANHNLSVFQVIQRINQDHPIPCEIFCKKLSPLESIVKFLHETHGYSFTKIAKLLNRSPKTIWQAAHNAIKKHPEQFSVKHDYLIPLFLFSNRKKSILSILVEYLHDQYTLTFAKIARLIERDPRTVWTAYRRYNKKKKRNAQKSKISGTALRKRKSK